MLDCGIIKLVSVGDICNVSRGASPRPIKKYLTQSGEGVPWIKIGDVSPFDKYIKKTNERITQEGAKKSRFLHKGDLILSNSMSFGRPYILEIDGCIHDGWISLSGFENYVLRDFLYEVLNTKCVQDYWAMKANNGGAMSNLNSDIVKSTIIKIPSLNVQEEIVKILDSFTNLIDALNEELSLREKQFEYYREKLLTFDDKSVYTTLGKVGEFTRGNGLQKKDFTEYGFPCIHYGQIHTSYNTSASSTISYCSKSLAKKLKKAKYGDLLIATTSEDVDACCKAIAWLGEGEVAYSGDSYCFSHNENPKYMAYLFQCNMFYNQKKKSAIGAKVIRVSGDSMSQFVLPIPSLSIQQSIVEKLDAFESLISSLKEEIALRQKQYEYYREKLLTFE